MSKRFVTKILAGTALVAVSAHAASAMTIQEAMEAAYQTNPQLLAAREKLKATDNTVAEAKAGWRPTIALSANVTRMYQDIYTQYTSSTPEDPDPRYNTRETYAISLEQSIYDGGKTSAQAEQARAAVRAGVAELRVSEQNVLISVIESYVNLVRDQATLELNTNNVEVLRRQLQATRDRFEVGEITLTDVAQAEARLSRTVASRESSQGNLATSLASFERDVGQPAQNISTPGLPTSLPATLEEALTHALANNPTLLNAKHVAEAAEQAVESEFADMLPTVGFDASFTDQQDATSTDDRAQTAQAGLTLSVPLYQGGGAHAGLRRAKKTFNQRKIEVEEVRRNAIQVVQSSWDDLAASRAQIDSRRAQVTAAEVALDGVRQEAAVGARTTLDVLDAEQELLDAQVALVAAERDEHIAAYQLLASMGALNARDLGLNVDLYDPSIHYDHVRDRWFGWDSDSRLFDWGLFDD